MIDNLPPRRELPPEVRDRMRLRIRAGLADESRPSRRRPMWLAAAAVVVLAAGAVFATGVLRDGANGPVTPAAPNKRSDAAQAVLDRCWNAAKPYSSAITDPRGWNIELIAGHGAAIVIAATIGDKPVFCEATATSVTVSDPGAKPVLVPGTNTKVLLRTVDGLVAGLADPSWQSVQAVAPGSNPLLGGPPVSTVSSRSHQFAVFTDSAPTVPVALGPVLPLRPVDASAVVPVAPAPLVTTVDLPAPAERTSEAGKFLGECLAGSQRQVPDRDAYVAGAYLSWNNRRFVVARLGQHVITCSARPYPGRAGDTYYAVDPAGGQGELKPISGFGALSSVLAPVKETGEPERQVFAGGVPPNVTRVSVTYPGRQPQDAVLSHGTFALWHTDADNYPDTDPGTKVKAYDAAGNVVIEAQLKLT
ncbi:hypothetical protein ABZU76_18680 [Amycolatopsis sp. NPDC005232]|uniref:hypothetical protein n=1 Tax=Amycolatopsis sp. NPDC005232 TaxID=3157027 RepID=UPI0033A483E1